MTGLPAELTVGEVAQRSGVAVSALHFYEAKGLIHSQRTAGNQRRYSRDMLRRIAIIRAAQRVGMPLAGIREALEVGLFVPATRYIDAQRHRGLMLKRWLEEVFGKVELLHVPAFGLPTPTLAECAGHAASPTLSDAYGRFTWPFAFLGLPSIVVPVGFQKDGLPAGMQLAGRPFAEALLLNAAHLYQRETRWHEKAPALPK